MTQEQAATSAAKIVVCDECGMSTYHLRTCSRAGSSAARVACVRCSATGLFEPCCSSHDALMCHLCYRLTHFVEVCGCPTCLADGLPRILGERERQRRSTVSQEWLLRRFLTRGRKAFRVLRSAEAPLIRYRRAR